MKLAVTVTTPRPEKKELPFVQGPHRSRFVWVAWAVGLLVALGFRGGGRARLVVGRGVLPCWASLDLFRVCVCAGGIALFHLGDCSLRGLGLQAQVSKSFALHGLLPPSLVFDRWWESYST